MNLVAILQEIELIFSLIPKVVDLVCGIQSVLPAQGTGAVKLGIVQSALKNVLAAEQIAAPMIDSVIGKLTPVINDTVGLFKTKGLNGFTAATDTASNK